MAVAKKPAIATRVMATETAMAKRAIIVKRAAIAPRAALVLRMATPMTAVMAVRAAMVILQHFDRWLRSLRVARLLRGPKWVIGRRQAWWVPGAQLVLGKGYHFIIIIYLFL